MMSLREAYFVLCLEAISSRKRDDHQHMEGIATPQGEHLGLAQQKNPRKLAGQGWSKPPSPQQVRD
jgi:hypothetical protein